MFVWKRLRAACGVAARLTSPPAAIVLILGVCLGLGSGGCGGGKKDLVLAKVGDQTITASRYEKELSGLQLAQLPKNDSGGPVDTATLEGKKRILDVMIDKELMILKAKDLGFDKEADVVDAAASMQQYYASATGYHELFEVPNGTISEEELQAYYANLSKKRECHFMICKFREDAEKARQAIIDGALWDDVAEEYHDGANPNGDYTVSVGWGQFEDSFEDAVFSLQPGEISEPIDTVYGWWIVQLDKETTGKAPPPLDDIKDRALSSIKARKIHLAQKKYMDEWHKKYDFKLDESALWIVYQGLPENDQMRDPVTNKITPREELHPLTVPLEDMDRMLYQVRLQGKLNTYTIGDYKIWFDSAEAVSRPFKNQMLGGLRQKILEEIGQAIIQEEVRERGYLDRPEVQAEVTQKIDEMLISKLKETLQLDKLVTPHDVEVFWQDHQDEYKLPEGREGQIVYCQDEATARQAQEAARAGKSWQDILATYGVDKANQANEGKTALYYQNMVHPVRDALFSLARVGDVSEPFNFEQRWAIVRLGRIEPERARSLSEVGEEVNTRLQEMRRNETIANLTSEWRQRFGVTVYDKNLATVRSWEELTTNTASVP